MNSTAQPPARRAPIAPTVAVSWGEFIDKATILEIKERRIRSPQARANVRHELSELNRALQSLQPVPAALDGLKQKLKAINEALWDIEDRIRAKEAAQSFDGQFIELARSVYHNNDERARIKREINDLMQSSLTEEKQYTSYKT